MTTIEQRMDIERRVIRNLIRIAYDAGWTIPFVHDGEELVKTDTHNSIMDAVFSVDESSIRFRKTVAYVCIDEDEYGNPVFEKWTITKRKVFSTV